LHEGGNDRVGGAASLDGSERQVLRLTPDPAREPAGGDFVPERDLGVLVLFERAAQHGVGRSAFGSHLAHGSPWPRSQSAPSIARLPGGWTRSSRNAPSAHPSTGRPSISVIAPGS